MHKNQSVTPIERKYVVSSVAGAVEAKYMRGRCGQVVYHKIATFLTANGLWREIPFPLAASLMQHDLQANMVQSRLPKTSSRSVLIKAIL